MINTVEKIYFENQFTSYKIITADNKEWFVPLEEGNRHYQAIQEWIAAGNTVIDNPPQENN